MFTGQIRYVFRTVGVAKRHENIEWKPEWLSDFECDRSRNKTAGPYKYTRMSYRKQSFTIPPNTRYDMKDLQKKKFIYCKIALILI